MRTSVLVVALGLTTSIAGGQVITPVPPAPAPLPEYTPPPPPPPAPAPVVQPPTPTPNLVKTGADGKIVVLAEPPEFAAARVIGLDPAKTAQLAALINDRQAKMDAMIIANPALALELFSKLPGADTMDINQMAGFPAMFKSFGLSPAPLEALRGSGIFSTNQLDAISAGTTAYRQALAEESKKVADGDLNKTMLMASRTQIKLVSAEFNTSMRRLLDQLVANWPKLQDVTTWPNAGELKSTMAGSDQNAKVAALTNALKGIPPEASGKLLAPFALQPAPAPTPAPSPK
ncbi:MAG: hypothetical protein ACK54T_03285 [bacterium]